MHRYFSAPAKINLCLHVLGRRSDGYHELAMIMQRVSLYDKVRIELAGPEVGIQVECPGLELPPGGENIASRAARKMLFLADRSFGIRIRIEKNIPVAAGLGGGSSDAAAVVMGLNEMLDLNLGQRQLIEVGSTLGADVPFFIFQHAAWATGIGDRLKKMENLPPVWYLLVNPGIAVSTAWVYGNLGLTSPVDGIKMPRFSGARGELAGILHNDLERITLQRFPLLEKIKRSLITMGALGALMSGSGPTIFGLFETREQARLAQREFVSEPEWKTFIVHPVYKKER